MFLPQRLGLVGQTFLSDLLGQKQCEGLRRLSSPRTDGRLNGGPIADGQVNYIGRRAQAVRRSLVAVTLGGK